MQILGNSGVPAFASAALIGPLEGPRRGALLDAFLRPCGHLLLDLQVLQYAVLQIGHVVLSMANFHSWKVSQAKLPTRYSYPCPLEQLFYGSALIVAELFVEL